MGINLNEALAKAKEIASKTADQALDVSKKAAETTKKFAEDSAIPAISKAAADTKVFAQEKMMPGMIKAKDKSIEAAINGKNELIKVLDQNGNGEIDIEDIIIIAIQTPGVKVDRSVFLKKEFFKLYPENIIDKAISETPAKAGIKREDIDHIADEIIKTERNIVSGVSAALGAPGGFAMLATVPADIAQYYGCLLRVMQKLLYLYGFPQIEMGDETSKIDSETINTLTLCLGTMYGVAGANNAIKVMAHGLAQGVSKKIMSTALTKGTIYPIVKKIASWFSVKMTKTVLTGIAKKSIPVIGGVLGAGITFFSFKPCCDRLKSVLEDTRLSNPEAYIDNEPIDIETITISENEITPGQE